MSSEVNGTAKFYLFIANNFNGSTDNMVAAMDNNNDGYLIKAEFTKYMKEHWAGNYTDSELNQFWTKFDQSRDGKVEGTNLRNLNALDAAELKKLEAQVEVYNEVKKYIEQKLLEYESVRARFGIDYDKFSGSVKESLFNTIEAYINSNFESANLEDELKSLVDTNIETAVAKTCANSYAQSYIASKVTYELSAMGYSKLGDEDIQNIVSAYIKSGLLTLEGNKIEEDLSKIIDAYFSTITNDPEILEGELAQFNWNGTGLNGLQSKIISYKMDIALGSDAAKFASLSDDFENMKKAFLQNKVKSGMTYKELLNAVENGTLLDEFRNSNQYKSLEVLLNYLDIESTGTTLNTGSGLELRIKQELKAGNDESNDTQTVILRNSDLLRSAGSLDEEEGEESNLRINLDFNPFESLGAERKTNTPLTKANLTDNVASEKKTIGEAAAKGTGEVKNAAVTIPETSATPAAQTVQATQTTQATQTEQTAYTAHAEQTAQTTGMPESSNLGNDLYNKILEKYGKEFADYIAEHDTDPDYGYADVVRSVAQKVASGALKTEAQIQNAIVNGLAELYVNFVRQSSGLSEVEGLGSADGISDLDLALADTSDFKWLDANDVDFNKTSEAAKTLKFNQPTLKNKNTGAEINIPYNRIRYTVEPEEYATVSGDKVTYSPMSGAGRYTIKLSVAVADSNGNWMTLNTIEKTIVTRDSGTDNINNVAIPSQVSFSYNYEGANSSDPTSLLYGIPNLLKQAAIKDGWNEDRASKAADTFKNYYEAIIRSINQRGEQLAYDNWKLTEKVAFVQTTSFTYKDEITGENVPCADTTQSIVADASHEDWADGREDFSSTSKSGIYVAYVKHGNAISGRYVDVKYFCDPNTLKNKFISFLH